MSRKVLAQVRIPADLRFSDLQLRRTGRGDTSLDSGVLARVLEASGIPAAAANEDAVSGIIAGWYRMHLAAGGAPDPVMEELIAEDEEEQRGRAN